MTFVIIFSMIRKIKTFEIQLFQILASAVVFDILKNIFF